MPSITKSKTRTSIVHTQLLFNSKKNGLNLKNKYTPAKAIRLFWYNTILERELLFLGSNIMYIKACINFISTTNIKKEQKITNAGVLISELIHGAMLFIFENDSAFIPES